MISFKEKNSIERIAKSVIAVCEKYRDEDLIEYSAKTHSFKIKTSGKEGKFFNLLNFFSLQYKGIDCKSKTS